MNYAAKQRLVFIEFLLFQYGCVKRSALVEYFGIGEATATRDLQAYKKAAPNNLAFLETDKSYHRTSGFERIYI